MILTSGGGSGGAGGGGTMVTPTIPDASKPIVSPSTPLITNPAKPTNLASMDIGKTIMNQKYIDDKNSPLNGRISGDTLYIDYYFLFAGAWDVVCPDSGTT